MSIYMGNSKVRGVYRGDTKVKKLYRGDELVYSASRLPDGFQEVEWIESDGVNCYIDTEFIANQNTRVVCEFMDNTQNNTSSGCVFGSRAGWNNKQFCLYVSTNSPTTNYYSYGSTSINKSYSIYNKRITIDANKNYWSSSILGSYTFPGDVFTTPSNLTLFQYYSGSSVAGRTKK